MDPGRATYRDEEQAVRRRGNSSLLQRREVQRVIYLLASVGLGLLLISALLYARYVLLEPSFSLCTRELNPYSPIIEAGVVDYYDTNFDNMFGHQTEYRGPPTPEMDQLWDDLWRFGAVEVPAEKVHRLNRSTQGLQRSPSGKGYLAMIEGFHQIHCLNLIRQYTWRDHYDVLPEGLFNATEKTQRTHVDHCLETLRLSFMCYSDVTPYFVAVNPNVPTGKKADFNVHHKCRNFDAIRDWTREHQVEEFRKDVMMLGDH